MFDFKAFFKKNRQKIGLGFQSGFVWICVIIGLAFTALTAWAIIYFFQQAFFDGFL
ncbi:Uncharacterised protein [Mesomycoplasma dispar]|uniref:Uncharacterized protein n=1 Tax=Mesomycoplasma dispar TaxID=86660 RepID=A0AAJ5NLS0_9BACT|nr:hypothetical protein [Mesomycoplasma dispar]VEU62264.1 Uncharacterised protein [Mesomycoplasma dispar]